ncbi:CHAT domain-containing protein [Nocardioides donggukensis]|uniref:CHAT domain-containing protein n=1 Tax=Nocardioides donggukensis TaxID=2774019 RepID=A0A927PZ04_9ACTN|nr:CHAT domain-containing protein [Nocardioides donggukensis]MBD8869308.1 CHAT domain-containing protein [Nocardioides donggukensis]
MAGDLLIRGQQRLDAAPEDDFAQIYGGQVRYVPRVRVITRAGGARGTQDRVPLDGDDDDIVEIETADGVVTFTSLRQARGRARGERTQYLDEAFGGARRGGSPVVDVRVIDFSPLKSEVKDDLTLLRQPDTWALDKAGRLLLREPARAAMQRIAAWLDKPVLDNAAEELRRKRPKVRGLYAVDKQLRLDPGDRLEEERARALSVDEPILVLLHGTFSHTEAAFGGLRGAEAWETFADKYDDRIVALEHATLCQSPLQNAIDLATLLPEGARLHMISHSRGGLIGDCLSFVQAHDGADLDLDLFDKRPRPSFLPQGDADPRREQFEELGRVVHERNLRIERFARVACPGSGTLLVSRRIDKYASFLFNVLKLAPGLQGTGVIEAVKLIVLTFLDQRSDVLAVPGLEAMMPESPFIGTLNMRARTKAADGMAVIAGDVEGSGVLKRLKVLGADAFFLADHDMVVNTRAMIGGVPRVDPRVATFRGSAYSHSSYFTDAAARAATLGWLDGKAEGFEPELVTKRHRWSRRRDATIAADGCVLIVPDLMGSTVSVGGRRVWPVPAELSRGLEDFLSNDGWNADGLVSPYDPILEALDAVGFRVEVFPYDGRRPLNETARQLCDRVRELFDRPESTLHVVTHGAGGRILRLAHALEPATIGRTGRRVLLSPPLEGSVLAAARVDGLDPLSAALSVLTGITTDDVGKLVKEHFPSLTELASKPEDDSAPWLGYVSVYGRARTTIVPRTVRRGAAGRADGFGLSPSGDGHVLPLKSHGEEEVLYVDAPFDDLVSADEPVELVISLLLEPGAALRGQDVRAPGSNITTDKATVAPAEYTALLPDADDLVWRSMGAPRPAVRRGRLDVSVVHGNLTAARERLVVGTQDGTPMGGAEKALDERLEGALSRHRLVGQYPGRLSSCQLFVRSDLEGPGAAIIGLGGPGDLTPGALTAGYTQAVERLVAALPEDPQGERVGREIELGTVLIGTTSLGGLNVASAVNAAITGVRRANRRIRDLEMDTQVTTLRIYELFEERAKEALEAAAKITDNDADGGDALVVKKVLVEGVGRRAGSPSAAYAEDRWRSIRVNIPKVGSGGTDTMDLFFNEIGRTAGAETLLGRGQRRIIDELIERCVGTPYVDEQTYNTLYELVVPRPMKGQGRPSEHIMYVLDDHAAKLPFEMFATRSFDDRLIPTATEVGMIRRLEIGARPAAVRPSSGRRALVIGDPYAGDDFEPLPGARHEAEVVADLLESRRFRVTRLISRRDRDPKVGTVDVLNALFAHEYRIIHIAAHGTFHRKVLVRNGVMIGPNTRLTALELRQLQTTPDLVFLNACHSGARVDHANELAANVARSFIDDGVRAVVATGWAVDDRPAGDFAQAFYSGLLGGENLGMATLNARKLVHRVHGRTSNTWGAYQVYGEPAFQFERDTTLVVVDDPKSRLEFRSRLALLADRARGSRSSHLQHTSIAALQAADGAELAAIQEDLEKLEKEAGENKWLQGLEYQEVGEVWRDLADYDNAIRAYESALAGGGSAAGLDIVAQLVSAHAHEGANHVRTGPGKCIVDHFGRACKLLELWNDLVSVDTQRLPDDPRPAGVGADHLRSRANLEQHMLWLSVEEHAGLDEAIERTRSHFQAACDANPGDAGEHYLELGATVLAWLQWHRRQRRASRPAPATLENRAVAAHEAAVQAPWSSEPFERQRVADAELALHLLTGRPGWEQVRAGYERAFRKSVSVREREAVVLYLELIHRVLPPGSPRLASVDRLRRSLATWVPGFQAS